VRAQIKLVVIMAENPSTLVSPDRTHPVSYFELLSSTFFSGASATFVSGGSAAFFSAPFASGFGRLKKALILSSTIITHLSCGRVLTPITVMAPHGTGGRRRGSSKLGHDFPSILPQEN